MNLNLEKKVALVTGASRGLGRATAEALAREGAKVVAVARSRDELAQLEAAYPGQCLALVGDMLDPDLPELAVQTALRQFGRLDVAIINTPGPRSIQPLEARESDFTQAFDSTFFPAMRLLRHAAAPMIEQRWGRILIISSTSVKAPKPFLCLSASTRSALWAWAKSAAPTLYRDGVTVNAIFAGPHDTERARELGVKERTMGSAHNFGQYLTSLCADATCFVTGTGFIVDGGELMGI